MVLGLNSIFLDPGKIYSLLFLIPLIILYLVRPKPKEKVMPSVMFFMHDTKSNNAKSFFQTFTKDWLFWLQLLTLLILALAVAKPFLMVPETALAEHTIIVLDISASMQAMKDGKTRFERAKDMALDSLGGKNTLILARNIPVVVLQEVDKDEVKEYIEKLKPVGTSTAIYDATRTALDYAGEGTRVVVLSDFIETEVDSNINSVKRALIARGSTVEFKSLASSVNNIGIVDLVVNEETTSVQVKNYFKEPKDVIVKIGNIEEVMSLDSGASDILTFSTPKGVNTVNLEVNDNFKLDNKAFISTPENTNLKVLFITNDENIEKSNLWVALQAISEKTHYDLTIETAVPPKSIKIDHDLIVLKDFDAGKILPGVFRDMAKAVEDKGSAVIITAQKGLFAFNPADDILPVIYRGEKKEGTDIFKIEPEIKLLTEEVNFGHVDYYFDTKPKRGVRVIASGDRDNSTIIAYHPRGQGKIFYYGIFDDDIKIDGKTQSSTFKHDLFYPIFWKRAVDLVTNSFSVDALNLKTGLVANLGNEKIKLPDGKVVDGTFVLEKTGVYKYRDVSLAVNMLNAKESDVSGQFIDKEVDKVDTEIIQRDSPKPLTRHFIILGLILLFFELVYTKMRGDM